MTASALVVAGGSGERMRRSGRSVDKPLVRVGGLPLIEHNVIALLKHGFLDVTVAVAASATDLQVFAKTRCAELVAAAGGTLAVIVEDPPLGSIGAAALMEVDHDETLVVNGDNLTTLDLAAVVDSHRASGAAMTVAVHDEPFEMPFGEIALDGDRVVAYREKPTYRITICTAVTVLGRAAVERITPGENIGLPALANRLLEADMSVHAHAHDAPWIDVNDLAAASRAEQLLFRSARA